MTLSIVKPSKARKKIVKPTDVKRVDIRSSRRRLTDSIKLFVCYAEILGSKSSQRYYMVFSRLLKTITGIDDRKSATVSQIQFLEACEVAVISGINNGMYNSIQYKQIYQNIKKKLESLKSIFRY